MLPAARLLPLQLSLMHACHLTQQKICLQHGGDTI